MQLLAFGCGYVASALARRIITDGGEAIGSTRSEDGLERIRALGAQAIVWPGTDVSPPPGSAWLISVPPDDEGCPVFHAFADMAPTASWIGYLSTTGVYGDLDCGWAFETTPLAPQSIYAERRVRAEEQWLGSGAQIFRLPGIYGPGRSQLDRVRSGRAKRIIKPGQVFSRAHRDDIVSALLASTHMPRPGAVYNICDDHPAPSDVVLEYAAHLLDIPPPPAIDYADADLSSGAKRFYSECRRVSNALAKAELGWRPAYPDYRSGLDACLQDPASS